MRGIASNVASVSASGIRRFFDIVADMTDVISLGVGEPEVAGVLDTIAREHPSVALGSYPRLDAVAPEIWPGASDEAFRDARAWVEGLRGGAEIASRGTTPPTP